MATNSSTRRSNDETGRPRKRLRTKTSGPGASGEEECERSSITTQNQGIEEAARLRKRLRTKTSAAAALGEEALSLACDAHVSAAIAELEEQSLLRVGVKRKNIHWTHVRTFTPAWVQPDEVTSQKFWKHLERIYAEVYPAQHSPTKSVLAFGLVCEERHAASSAEAQRALHRHCASVATEQIYWNRIAKLSLEKYKWPLNAVAHESYHTMFAYLRDATPKKPLHGIDADPYFSPLHPKGEAVAEFLRRAAGSHNRLQHRARQPDGEDNKKRERCPSIFDIVKEHGISSPLQLQARACSEAAEGRSALAEFCTKHDAKLPEILANAVAVMEAPTRLAQIRTTLMEKLESAANETCCCNGCWADGAKELLERNHISCSTFCAAMRRALELGALRGVNIACVGERGCGKSTLLEPLEKIFNCFPKPQAGSTFALAHLLDCDVMVWQDYLHDEKTIKFSDLLSLFVGEAIGIRLVGKNERFVNRAPLFYSGLMRMRCSHTERTVAEKLNGMMDDRFTVFTFSEEIPRSGRRADWPQCGACAASFFLRTHDAIELPLTMPLTQPASMLTQMPAQQGPPEDVVVRLRTLSDLRDRGHLDDEEYGVAKRTALGLMLL